MSTGNFENPYLPVNLAPPPTYGTGVKRDLDGTTKVLAILFIIFGAFGAMGLIWTIGMAIFMGVASTMNIDPASDFGKLMAQFEDALPVSIIVVAAIGGIASIVMCVAGGSVLKKRMWGALLLRNVALFYAGFKIVEVIVQAIVQFGGAKKQVARMQEQGSLPPNFDPDTTALGIYAFTMVIVGLFAIALFAFYLWVAFHMNKKTTLEQFQ